MAIVRTSRQPRAASRRPRTAMRRLVLVFGAIGVLLVVGALWGNWSRAQRHEIRYLSSKAAVFGSDRPDRTPIWAPTYGGIRGYTLKGDPEQAAHELWSELKPKGWAMRRSTWGFHFTQSERMITLSCGKSVMDANGARQVLISPEVAKHLKRYPFVQRGPYRPRSPDASGWLTIDYQWQSRSSPLKIWYHRLTRTTSNTWP